MSDLGRRPTLAELIEAIDAVERVEADTRALDPNSEQFSVVLTFSRAACPADWVAGLPKPKWLIDGIFEQLSLWEEQRAREEQWVSKEEQHGSSIDTLMAHYHEELKKVVNSVPQTIDKRLRKNILSETIVRLKELKERREAGGVYSATESRREQARKTWADDEYEAPKREEEQRRKQESADYQSNFAGGFGSFSQEELNKEWEKWQSHYSSYFDQMFNGAWRNTHQRPKPASGNKRAWYEILGIKVSATKDDIKKAYRKLAAQYHPDRYKEADGHARMAEINTARDEGLRGL